MYASEIVDQRLELAQLELGFRPEYHSVAEVELFDTRLQQKYEELYQAAQAEAQGSQDPDQTFQISLLKNLGPRLHPDEVRWMLNERMLCACDAAYFMTRYFWIKNEQNIVQRFTFRPAQRVYFSIVAELEARRASIELIAEKARQLGVSTETEGFSLQRICFTYGVNAVVASADRVKTGLMAQMLFFGYDMLSWWIKPVATRRVESDQGMLTFGSQRSGVSFQHGAQTSGIARGTTPTVFHLSECASYTDAGTQIEDALLKCVHASPNVFGVLESTAEGDTGWWYDTYWHAKKEWKRGRSRLCPMFLPWYLGTDLYPTPTWIATRPVPRDWRPADETREMMGRAKLYVRSNPILEKILGNNWEMGRNQAWFWEVNFQEHRAKGREKLWFQEMPTDDTEAFQGSYDNVFGREVIAQVDEKRQKNYQVYGIVGQSVEDRHEPDPEDVDYARSRIPVSYKSSRGEVYRWELVPLKLVEERDFDPEGKLVVFLAPEEGWDYSMGIDTSNGIGSDSTCIAVCRRARDDGSPDIQACEFRSSKVSHVEAYAFAMAIGAYYARPMRTSYESGSMTVREPYVSIEQIAAVGDTCQLQMKKMGWSRFHHMVRYDSKKIRKNKSVKMGWYTNVWSRPMLTDGFVVAVQNGWYVVHSPWTIYEMDHWEVHLTAGGKEKKEHQAGATDDGIFANAMATFCPNDLETLTKRTRKRCMDLEDGGSLPPIDVGAYNPGISSRGHGTMESPAAHGLENFL
jgi:hypothetical protein